MTLSQVVHPQGAVEVLTGRTQAGLLSREPTQDPGADVVCERKAHDLK